MEIIESFSARGLTKHNWDDYADGKIRKAIQGIDYEEFERFRGNVYTQAARRGLKGQCQAGPDFVEFRLIPRS